MLESLRRPLEDKSIKIIRERGEFEFPSEFLLVAAMNPCPCGNYPDLNKCNCTTTQIQNYLGKLSKPFLDRIDICVDVEKVQYDDLIGKGMNENSEMIRERIIKAREIQKVRYKNSEISTNSQLGMREIDVYCVLDSKAQNVMQMAYEHLGLTARTYHKVIGVARTIADLEGAENITEKHLREALGYRTMDRRYGRVAE